ncbi:MAG TPA: hypothetical protein VLA04_04210 [Verrucomicrobiae bacterium]|nr:hypothetical protein [Verrucomicrobiae bacterium]
MPRKFRPSELETDFDILFGPKSGFNVPFWDGDWFSSGINLFIGACIAWMGTSLLLGLFSVKVEDFPFWVYAIIAFVYCLVMDNKEFVQNWQRRRTLHKKYIPIVEHTEAYALLMEGLEKRHRGVVEGFSNKKETRRHLVKMWKAAFVEASQVGTPFLASGGLQLDERPVAEQMQAYFQERAVALRELEDEPQQRATS